MRIHGLCVVKDEGDMITETLTDALAWCDGVHVLDNGSSDDTWERVLDLASRHRSIVASGRDGRRFHDGMRALLFQRYATRARPGDWWCRLDADELYVEDPRQILASVDPDHFSVWSASLSYYLTEVEVRDWERDPVAFAATPVVDRCRHYLNHWSEPRFFRHVDGLRWAPQHGGFPPALWRRPAAPHRILLRHFAYRSPEQIQRRLDVRWDNPEFAHEAVRDWAGAVAGIRTRGAFVAEPGTGERPRWTDRVVPSGSLDHDDHDGRFVVNASLMPPLPKPIGALRALRDDARSRTRGVRARALVRR